MAKTVSCDRCKEKIENGGQTLTNKFKKIEWDLCDKCYKEFEEFMEKPV